MRKKHNLSQLKLANELNVHQTAVSQWEKGRTTPDFEIAKKMAELFQVSLDYLLGYTDIPSTSDKNRKPGTFELIGSDGSRTEMNVQEYDAIIAILKAMRKENKNQKG